MTFSPSRTQTLGSYFFLLGLSAPSGLPTWVLLRVSNCVRLFYEGGDVLQVLDVLRDVVTDTNQVSPLEVSVDVDLDDTEGDGLLELLNGGARTTVEDEEDGLVVAVAKLLGDELLVLAKQLGVELDVARLVDTVDVSEAGGDGEVGGDGGQSLVDGVDVLGLGVQGVVVNVLIVDTVLLTTSDYWRCQLGTGSKSRPRGLLPISISSHSFMGAERLRYLAVVSML